MNPVRFGMRSLTASALAVLLCAAGSASAKSAFLGIHMQELDEALLAALDLDEDTSGVLVANVVDGSAAAEAGIERGDIILQVDGREVASVSQLQRRIASFDSGDAVELQVYRDGRKRDVKVTLGEQGDEDVLHREGRRPDADFFFERGPGRHRLEDLPEGNVFFFDSSRPQLGVRLEAVGEKLGNHFGVDSGLLVLEVYEDSAAAEAGVEVGDVITEAAGQELAAVQDLLDILEEHEDGDTLPLKVVRDRKSTELSATLHESPRLEFGRGMLHLRGDDDHPMLRMGPRVRQFNRQGDRMRFRLRSDDELQDELQRLREELEELRGQVNELKKG